MSEITEGKWQAIVVSAAVVWLGWLSLMVVSMNAKMESQAVMHNNVIPPVIESSLAELRGKGNNQQELLTKLSEVAIGNAKDLSYATDQRNQINQRMAALESRLMALEKGH